MSVTVVVGGQYGGEGKGKITSYLALHDDVHYVVRCGGPNSGHTVDYKGNRSILRLLPAGVINPKTRLLIAPGAIINTQLLFEEIDSCDLDPNMLGIDYNTGIISDTEAIEEKELSLRERLGSTLSGMGRGVAKRVLREENFKRAQDIPELKQFLTNVSQELNNGIDNGESIIVEGTQGFGLSLYHSSDYPYVTSRDTTAGAFLSEVGLSPLTVQDIIMVIRTFPIRVGGNSGLLKNEISWEELQVSSGYPYRIEEFTSVTKRLRRVGRFDLNLVRKAAVVNRPTKIALMGTDYLDYKNKEESRYEDLTNDTNKFVQDIEDELGISVAFVGTGPTNEELIDRRTETVISVATSSEARFSA
jgi:adenylosuccinate synthase